LRAEGDRTPIVGLRGGAVKGDRVGAVVHGSGAVELDAVAEKVEGGFGTVGVGCAVPVSTSVMSLSRERGWKALTRTSH
jgi:hypothetical protein